MTDNLTGNTAGGAAGDQNDRLRHQFDWTGTLFKDNFIRGNHALQVRDGQRVGDAGVHRLRLPGRSRAWRSTARPDRADFTTPFRVTLRNTDRLAINSSWHHGAFITDQWQLSSRDHGERRRPVGLLLVLLPGPGDPGRPVPRLLLRRRAAAERLRAAEDAVRRHVHDSRRVRDPHALVGRAALGVAWDLFGAGKTVVKVELGPLLLQHRHRVARRQPGAEPDGDVRLERSATATGSSR